MVGEVFLFVIYKFFNSPFYMSVGRMSKSRVEPMKMGANLVK